MEEVATRLASSFEHCLDTLAANDVPIGIRAIQRDDETPAKIAKATRSIPVGEAGLIRVSPRQFTHKNATTEKDILITTRKSDLVGKVFTFFEIELDGSNIKSVLFAQEVNGYEFHQETTVTFSVTGKPINMVVNPGNSDEIKVTKDPSKCLQAIEQAIAHSVQPVERVIAEVTEEFDQLEVPSLENHRNRLAAAAVAFRHPERVAA